MMRSTAFFLVYLTISSAVQAGVKLSPQYVVEKALSEGTLAKQVEYRAALQGLALERELGFYDWTLNSTLYYEHDSSQATSLSNPLDKTTGYSLGVSKKFKLGTQASLAYESKAQTSTLSSFSQSLQRKPNSAQDVLSLTVRQPLLANSFGYADRLKLKSATDQSSSAQWNRNENLENLVLETMRLYWNAYIAQEQLKANISARDKYQDLVKSLRRKAGFNLSSPGELPRVEAEFQNAEARVKLSSAEYVAAVEELLVALKMPRSTEIGFDIPEEVPRLPQLVESKIDNLRVVRIAEVGRESGTRELNRVENVNRPQLDLVAKARTTGNEEMAPDSRAEMFGGTNPTYYVGLELTVPIDSSASRSRHADAVYNFHLAELEKQRTTEVVQLSLQTQKERVVSYFALAESWVTVVGFRARVVKEMETSYRQGRSPLVELIRAYNEMFSAQLERARSVGQYHIALNQLAATMDELVLDGK